MEMKEQKNNTIKLWLNKYKTADKHPSLKGTAIVEGKKYDAFDIQRAIMSGPVRDTHTGERDFLRVLWNKVRDGFRRYSKRGKLR